MKLSTDLRTALVGGFADLTVCQLYSGTIPATGNTAPTGTLIARFSSDDSSYVTWDAPASGAMSLMPSVVPTAVLASGTVGYVQFSNDSDRSIYCTVGTSGTEVILSKLALSAGELIQVVSATLAVPAT